MLLVMYRRQAEINKFVVYSFVCPPQVNLFCSGLARNLTQFFDGLFDRCAVTLYFDSQSEERSVHMFQSLRWWGRRESQMHANSSRFCPRFPTISEPGTGSVSIRNASVFFAEQNLNLIM